MLCNKLPANSLTSAHDLVNQQFMMDLADDHSGLLWAPSQVWHLSDCQLPWLIHVTLILLQANLGTLSWWKQGMSKQFKLGECFSSVCLYLLAKAHHLGKPRIIVEGYYQATCQRVLLWTESLCSSRNSMLQFYPPPPHRQYDGISKCGLWEVIRIRWSHKSKAFMSGISVLLRVTRWNVYPLCSPPCKHSVRS